MTTILIIYLLGCLVSLIMCYVLTYLDDKKPHTLKDYLIIAAVVSFSWVGVVSGVLVIIEENQQ